MRSRQKEYGDMYRRHDDIEDQREAVIALHNLELAEEEKKRRQEFYFEGLAIWAIGLDETHFKNELDKDIAELIEVSKDFSKSMDVMQVHGKDIYQKVMNMFLYERIKALFVKAKADVFPLPPQSPDFYRRCAELMVNDGFLMQWEVGIYYLQKLHPDLPWKKSESE